jgi:nitronate monooxygenase
MGTVSTPALAVAVADAGGVGTVTAIGLDAGQLRTLLEPMVRQTDGVLSVNFLTSDVDREAVAVAAEQVKLIDFFWSDPDRLLVDLVHSKGALANWQVGSIQEARAAAAAGCDLVTVQGMEAGAHVRGYDALLPLLSSVVEELSIPVLAAGGIADARGVAAVIGAGAAGARIGTRFIASDESGAHPLYKAAVVEAAGADTQITDMFSVCPLCATLPRARVLNTAVEAMRTLDDDAAGEVDFAAGVVAVPKGSGMPPSAATRGHIEAMALYAGMGTSSIRDVVSASEIVDRLSSGAERLLRAWR